MTSLHTHMLKNVKMYDWVPVVGITITSYIHTLTGQFGIETFGQNSWPPHNGAGVGKTDRLSDRED